MQVVENGFSDPNVGHVNPDDVGKAAIYYERGRTDNLWLWQIPFRTWLRKTRSSGGGVIPPDPPTPDPVADFEGTPLLGVAPLTVAFTNLSVGLTSYLWDFGDGASTTEENPSHDFDTPGEYTVELSGSGPGGVASETKTAYIVVLEELPAPFYEFYTDVGVFKDDGGGYATAEPGDQVSKLEDQSGNARHRLQASAPSQPLLSSDLPLNGYPSISGGVLFPLIASPWSAITAFTEVMVIRAINAEELYVRLDPTTVLGTSALLRWRLSSWSTLVAAVSATPGEAYVVTYIINGANSKIRVNGVEVISGDTGASQSTVSTLQAGEFFADVAYDEALSDEQCEVVETAFATRFGISL